MTSRFHTPASAESIARHRARIDRGRALKIERSRPTKSVDNRVGLDKGDVVRHAAWGDGVVVHVVGDNVLAAFTGQGEKLVRASFLMKIG